MLHSPTLHQITTIPFWVQRWNTMRPERVNYLLKLDGYDAHSVHPFPFFSCILNLFHNRSARQKKQHDYLSKNLIILIFIFVLSAVVGNTISCQLWCATWLAGAGCWALCLSLRSLFQKKCLLAIKILIFFFSKIPAV